MKYFLLSITTLIFFSACQNQHISRGANRATDRFVRGGDWERHGGNSDFVLDWLRKDRLSGDERRRWADDRSYGGSGDAGDDMLDWLHRDRNRNSMMAASTVGTYTLIGRELGRVYGISTNAATKLLFALNRAAGGDFRYLEALGLNRARIIHAYRNQGRLDQLSLQQLSRTLKVTPKKVQMLVAAFRG